MIGTMTSGRATGKTYRLILESLRAASEGHTVAFMCHSNAHAKQVWMRAKEMCAREATASNSERDIRFPNGGKIIFHYGMEASRDNEKFRGIKIDLALKDLT